MLRAAIAVLSTATLIHGADNDNAAEFRIFCDLLHLQTRAASVTCAVDDGDVNQAITDLEYLNLTAADDSWLTDKNGELADKSGADSNKQAREEWQTKVKQIGKADQTTGVVKYKKISAPNRKAGLAAAINRSLTTALQAKGVFNTNRRTCISITTTVATKINDALFGTGNTEFSSTGIADALAANCVASGNPPKAGRGIAYDLLCLCGATDSNGIKRCDQSLNSSPATSLTSGSNARERYTEIQTKCHKNVKSTPLTAAELRALIASFESRLGANTAGATTTDVRAIFGKPHTGGQCDASSQQGMCINYKELLADAAKGIPWVNSLEAAATAVDAAAAAKTTAERAATTIVNIANAAWALHDDAALNPSHATTATQATAQTSGKNAEKTAEATCNAAKDQQDECDKLKDQGCVFNKDGKEGEKCTLNKEDKQALEKANQETGGKDGKTDCSSHQDQKSCEKENEGLTASAPVNVIG
uniref:Variant surface glycoprotein 1128 n=1 Tax=Trypanosoma brucei TaxID=5691 RepID=M4SZD4_9TRYP|nr:variant surface glycoprotein 1128 [Trypanosoma brucei]